MDLCDEDTYKKINNIIDNFNIDENILDVVKPALERKRKWEISNCNKNE